MAPKNRARSHPPKSYHAIPTVIGCNSMFSLMLVPTLLADLTTSRL